MNLALELLQPVDNNKLIVSHGGFINVVLHVALGISLDRFPLFTLDNLHGVLLTSSDRGNKWMLKAMNIGPEYWKHELV